MCKLQYGRAGDRRGMLDDWICNGVWSPRGIDAAKFQFFLTEKALLPDTCREPSFRRFALVQRRVCAPHT